MICHRKDGEPVAPASRLIPGRLYPIEVEDLLTDLLDRAKDAHSSFEKNHLDGPDAIWQQVYAAMMTAMLLDMGYSIVLVRTNEKGNPTTEPIVFPIRDEDEADLDARNEFAATLNRSGREL